MAHSLFPHDAATIVTGLDRASQRATSRRRGKRFPSDCAALAPFAPWCALRPFASWIGKL